MEPEISLQEQAEKQGIKYFLPVTTSFSVDSRACLVPVEASKNLTENGYLFYTIGHFKSAFLKSPKSRFIPDTKTLIQLPWQPEIGWLLCNMYEDTQYSPQCPRMKLSKLQERAQRLGFTMKTGIEPEFTLLDKDKHVTVHRATNKNIKVYQDRNEVVDKLQFATSLMDIMVELGWEPYQFEQEGDIGQCEIVYAFADALTTADRHTFFKFMSKELAKKHGFRASYMPMPFSESLSGNGLHINISLWDVQSDVNLMPDSSTDLGYSAMAQHFIAGVLKHAKALCAILCPQVNSYKRLHGGTVCGENGSQTISWSVENRLACVRLTACKQRIEVRFADSSANAYVVQAALLAAGLDGIEHKLELSESLRLADDMSLLKRLEVMPQNLQQACDFLQNDEDLIEYLGKDMVEGFIHVKMMQIQEERNFISEYEKSLVDDY